MLDRREHNRAVFWDTMDFCDQNRTLRQAIEHSMALTSLYAPNAYPDLAEPEREYAQKIVMRQDRTFAAAQKLHAGNPDKKITVLNFASATHPGGGVKKGSTAQEESLCRCSTLYPTLDQQFLWDEYYDKHYRARDPLYSDAIIYSPGVVICKTDDDHPQRLPDKQFVTVDVISCAAPNLRSKPGNSMNRDASKAAIVTADELLELHKSRARHILHIAAVNHADILVLGAFGCGVFQNNPHVVAKAYAEVIPDYRCWFDMLVFAIHCRDEKKTDNYLAFERVFRHEA